MYSTIRGQILVHEGNINTITKTIKKPQPCASPNAMPENMTVTDYVYTSKLFMGNTIMY